MSRDAGLVRVLAFGAVVLALLGAFVTWSVSSPVASSADEDFHLASIWCGDGLRDGYCEEGSSDVHRTVPRQLLTANQCFDNQPEQSAACPGYPSSVMMDTDRGNFAGVYPQGFYAVMGLLVSADISASVIAMRVLNSLLYVVMMSALFLLIPARRRGLLVWGSLATMAPFGMFLIPSVNPSSWGVISASTLWIALLGYYEARTTTRRIGLAVLACAAVLMAVGSRADAAAYAVVAIGLVSLLKGDLSRPFLRMAMLPAVLAVVAVIGFLSAGQANSINPGFEITAPTEDNQTWISLLWDNLLRLPELWAGAFGAPVAGRALWLGTVAPGIVWVPVVLVVGGLVFFGLRRLDWRKSISLAAIALLLTALPMIWLMRDQILVGQGVQARYLYPLIIVFVTMSLVGYDGVRAGLTRLQMTLIAIVALAADAAIQWVTLRRFVTGLDAHGINLNAGAEWWWDVPIGPMHVWLIGAFCFAGFCVGCVLYGVLSRSQEPEPARP
ncbi:DUF2142 domain-containing protein [Protaetiibacter mangrovi]|uniref:DUF2142 domain-containing protein n=1 Tax=Protaetiibacter mangrovi TaxID=2970926 RepID=A0ABT1ZFH7_9MICO|nr:DUF2142 domain-containing protein [Protaetiibacter mangrovi]MCS0499468.1 DUF2142 domain-containing protein [Protaetiibacter mangrovi]TPX02797.1 DUF2142 domain-containing protein [Schumannella luteola]